MEAATLALQLRAQQCVRTPGATPGAGPHVELNTASAVSAAKAHIERLRETANKQRAACTAAKPCPAADRADDQLIRSTVAYLAIVTGRGGGADEAKQLLVNTLPVDASDVAAMADRLRPGPLSDKEVRDVLGKVFDALQARSSDKKALKIELERLAARLRAGAGPGADDAQVIEALVARGLKPDEAKRIVVQLGESFRGLPPEAVRQTFALAAYVRDPEVLRAWRASLGWLFGRGENAPTDLVAELDKASPSPTALLDIVSRMHEEQAKALVSYGSVLAQVEEQIRVEQNEQRTPRRSVIVFAPKRPATGCGDSEAFQLGIDDVLTRLSPDGIRMPLEIDADKAKFDQYLESALCRCRGGVSCGPGPAIAGICEGVVGIRIEKQKDGDSARAYGSVRFAMAGTGEGAAARRFESGEVLSRPFPLGCDPPVRAQQAQAALEFLQAIAHKPVVFRLFPSEATPAPDHAVAPSRWSALLLSGLPYLRDSRTDNDRTGWLLVAGDVGLTACAVGAGALAAKWRNDYSAGQRSTLSAANSALTVAASCLGALVVERFAAVGFF